MIKSISVTSANTPSLFIDMVSPEESGLIIKDIDGIGPIKTAINVTEFTSSSGGMFNSSHTSFRNIVITLGLKEKPSIEHVRLKTYKHFPIGEELELEITTDLGSYLINGYVEDNAIDIFSKEEIATISIICPNPYFRSKTSQTTLLTGITPNFEFPFSNESLVDKLIAFGSVILNTNLSIVYAGDIDVGVTILIHFVGTANDLVLHNLSRRQTIRIDTAKIIEITGSRFKQGDNLVLSTVKGNKFITLHRGVNTYNLLNAIYKNTSWFTLAKGVNLFAYAASSGIENLHVRIDNDILFVGV